MAVCSDLGLDPGTADARKILDVTRDVAHNVDRPSAPVTAYLMGVAVGRGMPLKAQPAVSGSWLKAGQATPRIPRWLGLKGKRQPPRACCESPVLNGAGWRPGSGRHPRDAQVK
jgi:hypothetical protein